MVALADGEDVDIEICEGLRRGDPQAYRSMVGRYGPVVYTLSVELLRDRARAEDVMQETFMKGQQTIATLREPKKLGAWLKRIAHNLGIDHLRKRKRERRYAEKHRHEVDEVPPLAPHEQLPGKTQRALKECLALLPPEKRAAVMGRHFAGLDYAELAATTGETMDAVRVRVARALAELRDCLEKKGVTL